MKRTMLVMLAAGSILFGCGGGADTSDQLASLRSQAAAKEVEARSLAVDSPCTASDQCSGLVFGPTTHVCAALPPVPYLLAATNAVKAEAAASEQRVLASQVQGLLPSDGLACPFAGSGQAMVSCVASKCVLSN